MCEQKCQSISCRPANGSALTSRKCARKKPNHRATFFPDSMSHGFKCSGSLWLWLAAVRQDNGRLIINHNLAVSWAIPVAKQLHEKLLQATAAWRVNGRLSISRLVARFTICPGKIWIISSVVYETSRKREVNRCGDHKQPQSANFPFTFFCLCCRCCQNEIEVWFE